ncbi:MAG: hypothetical protein J0H50_14850 [Xanthomonadales bacterium]|nr:hypothetical protein [Xanthomonadales bacterium]
MPLADYQTRVDDLVRDRDNVISDPQRDAAIDTALAVYSADRPRQVVVDVTSGGGQRIDLPAGWVDDSSTLVAVEFPIDQVPASELPLADVRIYNAPSGRKIELPIPTADGDVLRLTYTAAQLLDATDDTVPLHHRNAVASLAASLLCTQLAIYYATEGEPSIAADTVDRKNKSDRFRLLAKDLAAAYSRVVGSPPSDRNKGASVTVPMERNNALGGKRLFHPTRDWPR